MLPARASAPALALLVLMVLQGVLAGTVHAQDRPNVGVAKLEQATVTETTRINGSVVARRHSSLSTSVSGRIETVSVEAGDRVSEGEPLLQLDDERDGLTLDSASASVSEARASLDEARRRLREAESVGAGSNIAATEVSARRSAVAEAEARLARLEAERERQRVEVERHRIEAPFAGLVTERNSDPGEWVDPGDTLLTLVDTDHLYLDFQVPQTFFGREGEARLTLTGPKNLAGRELPISAVIGVVAPELRTYRLRSAPDDVTGLSPGMSVTARLSLDTGQQGVAVPRDAINRYPDGRVTVWTLGEKDDDGYKVEENLITVAGDPDGETVVVTKGVEEGDRVVTRGNESLSSGMGVRVDEPEDD
ncbi:MAG: efflux RND transporter periplasmic adaptor subunit [Pseudomonadota bacterium]